MITDSTAPPLPEALDAALRRMRLPYLRHAAPDVLATARAQRWDPAEVVRVLLAEEIRGRDQATRTSRRNFAGLPAGHPGAWPPRSGNRCASGSGHPIRRDRSTAVLFGMG